MGDATEMAERHGATLARLSELGLALAEHVQAQALTADDPKTSADLGLAFHRIARTVRQSIALEAKLVRDAQTADRAERAAQQELQSFRDENIDPFADTPRDQRRIDQRKEDIRARVAKAIWAEVEQADREQADYLTDLLEERLELFGRSNGFGLEPLAEHAARFYAEFGLQGPEADGAYHDHEDTRSGAAPRLEPYPQAP